VQNLDLASCATAGRVQEAAIVALVVRSSHAVVA